MRDMIMQKNTITKPLNNKSNERDVRNSTGNMRHNGSDSIHLLVHER